MIRKAEPSDAVQICGIYNYYIEQTLVTFEHRPLLPLEMEERIQLVTEKFPWIVMEEDGEIIGYAYATKWRERYAYRFVVETTVYLKNDATGKGYGAMLYAELIEQLKQRGFHAAIGCISLPNDASVKLHERLGFKKAAHFTEVGFKFNQWVDIGFWQLML